MQFQTINATAKELGISHTALRTMQKQNRLPGYFVGTRFYCNVPMLREMLDAECRANASMSKGA